MNKVEYINRYNDVYTFSLDEDGSILWEGSFQYCRIGWPNNYTEAYRKYLEVEGTPPREHTLSLAEFKEEVHRSLYDRDDKYLGPCIIAEQYQELVTPDRTKLDMVDPSGGPYIGVGGNMNYHYPAKKGIKRVVTGFVKIPTGYKILVDTVDISK